MTIDGMAGFMTMDESTPRSRHPDSLGQVVLWALLPTLLLILNAPDATYAQVVTNITPTAIAPLDLGTNVDTVGSTTHITGGTRPGSGTNLFHSFDAFKLGTGDTAHFLNDMQLPTNNIFGRVIGGEVSTIDGTLRTNNPLNVADPMNFGSANLWLVNPSGLLLGPNARIEVGGSVSLSTANYLRFEGTAALLDMLSSPASLGPLSVAPVAAFGFLSPEPPAPITIQGSMLQVPEGHALSLVGGDITAQAASLRAPGGQINLVSLASPGEVLVPSFQTGLFTSMGTVTLNEGAMLDVSGQFDEFGTPIGNGNSGTVFVRGGQLVMDASTILATTVGAVDGARTAVDIQVSQNVALTNGAAISGATSGSGRGGDVTITAHALALANQAIIRADTFGVAPAGNITLNVGTLTGSPISAITSNSWLQDATAGRAGTITIQGIAGSGTPAATVSLDSSLIETGIFGGSAAVTPGAITITAQTLALTNAGTVGADTQDKAPAGDITLNVDTLTVGDGNIGSTSWLQNTTAGKAGNITIQGISGAGSSAAHVRIEGGISSISTINTGINGGTAASTPATITITAQELVLDKMSIGADTLGAASAGDITLNVDTLTLGDAGIASTSSSNDATAGKAGTITIQGVDGAGSFADTVSLDNNSHITTTIFGGNAGTTPGAITITAQALALQDNGNGIRADTNGAAPAGGITLNVDTLTAANSAISSSNAPFDFPPDSAIGNAGNITIQGVTGPGSPAANVSLDNSTISTTIVGGSSSTIPAKIDITAQTVNLANGAQISANTSGAAPAGDTTLNVGTLTVTGSLEGFIFSEITSNSSSFDSKAGNAGNITIQGVNGPGNPATSMSLDNSTISTTINGGTVSSSPATIDITAHTVNLAIGAQISANTSGAAPAGDITLNVGTLAGIGSVISSGSGDFFDPAAGNAGNITIQGITGSGSPAGHVSLDGSEIRSETFGGSAANTAANIDITAQTLALAHGTIRADSNGTAPAGDITLNVGKLTVDSSPITSFSVPFDFFSLDSPTGNAGSITIQGITGAGSPAAEVSLLPFTGINTGTVGGSAANTAANIDITAQTLALAANVVIAAGTFGAAPAGDITLNVGTLTVGNFSEISSSSDPFSFFSPDPTAGNAGNITIQGITGAGSPAATVSLDGSRISTRTTEGRAANTAANIDITTQTLALTNFATIEADTWGAAPAGNITLNVGTLTASGALGGDILKGIISNSPLSRTLQDETVGNAGSITIQGITGSGSAAATVRLDNSNISTVIAGGTSSSVPANIMIAAQAVTLSNGADITANTTGNAPAGNIGLVTQQLTMTPDSVITSNALSELGVAGKAGSITITGAGSAPTMIAGGTIQAQSETSASAGDITLHAPGDLTLLGTTISVKNTGTGNAGSINVRAGSDLLVRNSQVSTESAEASGGNIKLTAPNLVRIVDSTLTSSVQGQAGSNGGNIDIDPQFVVIQNSQLLANANAGAGGNITIAATGAVLIDPNSLLSASAGPAGVSGSVNINAPNQVLSGTLVPLTLAYSQAALSGDRCAADPTGQFSSFVQTGRDGVPQVPGALSPSPLSFLETLTSGSLGSQSSNWAAARLGLDSVRVDDSTRFRFHSACRS